MRVGVPLEDRVVRAVVAGHELELTPAAARARLEVEEPEPVRDHFVVVGGRRFPVKQALEVVAGLDRADFTSQHARRLLQRLGFDLGRLGGRAATPAPRIEAAEPSAGGLLTAERYPPERLARARRRADALRPFVGRWVAVRGEEVITAGDSLSEVARWLKDHDQHPDSVFGVPEDPTTTFHDRPL